MPKIGGHFDGIILNLTKIVPTGPESTPIPKLRTHLEVYDQSIHQERHHPQCQFHRIPIAPKETHIDQNPQGRQDSQ